MPPRPQPPANDVLRQEDILRYAECAGDVSCEEEAEQLIQHYVETAMQERDA